MNVAQVLDLVVGAGVLSAEQAEEWRSYWAKEQQLPDDGEGLIAALLAEQEITDFQARALRNGVPGPYKLGPYRLFDRVAVGRLGTIFRAVHEEFQQPVGLKVFPADLQRDPERALRLARETRVAVQVDHPHVVRTFQVGRAGETVYLAIEDLRGWTLADRLEAEEVLDPLEACRLMREVALGLDHLHALDIVHRDVQPANIWLTETGHAKIMEFAAARDALADLLEERPTDYWLRAEILGSYDYLSSQQAANQDCADSRTDVYSLGCVLFRCLTGQVVFPDENPVRKIARHAHEPARYVSDLVPEVPREISDVVATMLAKNPDERYQTAEDVAWALEQVIDVEEKLLAAEEEFSEGFLEWARAHHDELASDQMPTVVAHPEFIGFVHALSEEEAESANS